MCDVDFDLVRIRILGSGADSGARIHNSVFDFEFEFGFVLNFHFDL